jgi:predicted negative regulator of RcsB-dependent stress response
VIDTGLGLAGGFVTGVLLGLVAIVGWIVWRVRNDP